MMKEDFIKNNYIVYKNAITKDMAYFLYYNLKLNKQVLDTYLNKNFISPYDKTYGFYDDNQIPNTYSFYGNTTMDTLLHVFRPYMETATGEKLIESYSYTRLYKKGDELKRHKDRLSCEISTTLNLGGDPWPIFLEPSGERGKEGTQVDLDPGDMLIYKGCLLEHWREPFEGTECAQVFLHYNKPDTDNKRFDGRIHLGLPKDPLFLQHED